VVLLSAKVAQLTRSFLLVFRNDLPSLMSFFPDLFFDYLTFWISSFFSYFLYAFFFFSCSFFPPVFIYLLFLTLISFSFSYLSFFNLSFLAVPFSLLLSILFFYLSSPLYFISFLFMYSLFSGSRYTRVAVLNLGYGPDHEGIVLRLPTSKRDFFLLKTSVPSLGSPELTCVRIPILVRDMCICLRSIFLSKLRGVSGK
jgi:hypothetical protein